MFAEAPPPAGHVTHPPARLQSRGQVRYSRCAQPGREDGRRHTDRADRRHPDTRPPRRNRPADTRCASNYEHQKASAAAWWGGLLSRGVHAPIAWPS